MKKSTLGDFDFSDIIHQIDLDSLQSFFGHHGMAIRGLRVPRKMRFIFGPSTAPTTILRIPP